MTVETYYPSIEPLQINRPVAAKLWGKFKRSAHWYDYGQQQFFEALLDPNFIWFAIHPVGRERIGGLIWLHNLDLETKSTGVSIVLFDHFDRSEEMVEAFANQLGVTSLWAGIKRDNKFSRGFVQELGFTQQGELEAGVELWVWEKGVMHSGQD